METLAIGAANSIYLIAAVMLGCGILLLWGVAFSGFRKTKRTGQIVATVILALATIGLGFLSDCLRNCRSVPCRSPRGLWFTDGCILFAFVCNRLMDC